MKEVFLRRKLKSTNQGSLSLIPQPFNFNHYPLSVILNLFQDLFAHEIPKQVRDDNVREYWISWNELSLLAMTSRRRTKAHD